MSFGERVLVVDDHPIVLDGISMILKALMDEAKIYTALDAEHACNTLREQDTVDWIFLDVNLPDQDGIALISTLMSIAVTANIIILSSDSGPALIDRALRNHANGFLSKAFTKDELKSCIQTVASGRVYLSANHQNELKYYRDSVLTEKQSVEKKLSQRQLQTLELIANGYSNQEIAVSLKIVESTVKSHVHALMTIFEADNRTHCVAEAHRLDIIG